MSSHIYCPFDPLINHISSLINWSHSEMSEFADRLELNRYKKKSFLIKTGDAVTGYFFINKGFCRIFRDINGKESTFQFVGESDFATDIDGVMFRQPSLWALQALTATEAIFISFDTVLWARQNLAEGEKLMRKLWERYCVARSKAILYQHKSDPLLRYESLITVFPDIDQRVPQKMIASYLNCTPEHFSVLKSKVIRSND